MGLSFSVLVFASVSSGSKSWLRPPVMHGVSPRQLDSVQHESFVQRSCLPWPQWPRVSHKSRESLAPESRESLSSCSSYTLHKILKSVQNTFVGFSFRAFHSFLQEHALWDASASQHWYQYKDCRNSLDIRAPTIPCGIRQRALLGFDSFTAYSEVVVVYRGMLPHMFKPYYSILTILSHDSPWFAMKCIITQFQPSMNHKLSNFSHYWPWLIVFKCCWPLLTVINHYKPSLNHHYSSFHHY